MIKKGLCLSFFLGLLTVFTLVSCFSEPCVKYKYRTVEFNSNGGSEVESQIVIKGCTAVRPVDPVYEGHDFIGWFDDKNLPYDFSTPVTHDIVLKANWTAASEEQCAAATSEITFKDKVQDKQVSFTVMTTPNGEKDDLTTVTIPSGAIVTDSKEDSMSSQMTVISYAVEVAPVKFTEFTVQEGEIVVAGIDCKLIITENGKERTVEDFNGQKVTVSTYTLKGLKAPNVSYDGDKSQPTDVTYDSTTGLLTFCTTHFSTFLVTSESVAYVKETKLAYDSLSSAISAAQSGESVILLNDVELKSTVSIDKDLILDLNGQTLTASVTSGDLFNITDSCSFEIDGNNGKLEFGTSFNSTGSFIFSEKGASTVNLHDVTVTGTTCTVAVYCKGVATGADVNSITITDGVFTGAIKAEGGTGDAYVYINGGTFKSCSFSAEGAKTHIVIKGGTFDIDPTVYVASGYFAQKNDGEPATWTVLPALHPDENNVIKIKNEAELESFLSVFNSGDSEYMNKDYTIELPAGTFGGTKSGNGYIAQVFVLKQYAKWNDDYNSRDNLQGVLDSHRGLTIVGSSDPDNRTDFKGIFVITGNGNSNDYCSDDNVKTVIQNIDFDFTDVIGQSGALDKIVDNGKGKYFPIIVCAAASNINIEGCTFKHTERIKIGYSANAVTPKEFYDENGKVRYLTGYGFFTTIKNCKFEDVNAVADGYPKGINTTDPNQYPYGADKTKQSYYKEALVLDNITASGLTSGFVNIQTGSNVMDTVIKNCTASGSGYGVRVQAQECKVKIKDSTITITGGDNYFLAFRQNGKITVTLDNVAVGSGGSTEIYSVTADNNVILEGSKTDNTPSSFTLTGSSTATVTDNRT